MAFVIDRFWLPLLLAGVIGIMIGWATCGGQKGRSWLSSWLPLALLAAIGAGVALAQDAVPGRYALWLETALMMFLAYLSGCCIACFLQGLFGRPSAAGRTSDASFASFVDGTPAHGPAALASTAAAGTMAAVTGAASAHPADAADESRPHLLTAPRDGKGDDLTLIWGVAEKLEWQMNKLGIWHFDQIAAWTPQHVAWFENEIEGFKGRLERDKWVEQCGKLAAGWRPDNKVGSRPKG